MAGYLSVLRTTEGAPSLPQQSGQIVAGGQAFVYEFENGIGSERVMIVLVLIAGEDPKDPHAYHLKKGMLDEVRITRVVQNLSKLPSQAYSFVELS